jgi:hypothetical protein
MEIVDTMDCILFDEFEVASISAKPQLNKTFFKSNFDNKQSEQLKILEKIGNGIPFYSGKSFGEQVHFQSAHKTPVQRWFPYREGYSISLVDTFIKGLKIKGNVFDPFAGSGTTLLAARSNDLHSFGIDVNPISVFIARVENDIYTKKDIIELEEEMLILANLEKSEKDFHTPFPLADKVFNKEILQVLLQFREYINHINSKKVKNIFFLAWLSILEGSSNIKKEGNGIKYKNRKRTPSGYITIERKKWEEDNFPAKKYDFLKGKLLNNLTDILYDLKFNYGRCDKKPNIYQGSCLDFDGFFNDEIELTFFSPLSIKCKFI